MTCSCQETPPPLIYQHGTGIWASGRFHAQKLINSSIVKEMIITDTHLNGTCEDCIIGKMDKKPFNVRNIRDTQIFGTLHVDLMGLMNPEARWSHARFCLIINDDCSGFAFVF